MVDFPKVAPFTLLACTWLFSMAPNVSRAQFSISLDDDDTVRLQNGSQAPLVVPPGHSFGGTLTNQGFQGVMSSSKGTKFVQSKKMPAAMANPFRDPAATKSQPLKIQAGDVSLTLPMAAPVQEMDKPMLPAQKLQAVRTLVRMNAPTAMQQVDKLMQVHAPNADLMQMKALLLMQAGRHRDAAAFAYDAMAMDPKACWTWAKLRATLADRDAATAMYRLLQRSQREQPSLEMDFLMAWWERMLDHQPEAVNLMNRLTQARPKDPVFQRMLSDWTEMADDTPPTVAAP